MNPSIVVQFQGCKKLIFLSALNLFFEYTQFFGGYSIFFLSALNFSEANHFFLSVLDFSGANLCFFVCSKFWELINFVFE